MRSGGRVGENKLLKKGDRVPSSLKPCSEAAQIVVGPSRGPRVFVAVHDLGCDECTGYVQQIRSIQEELASWGGHVAVVGPECTGSDAAGFAGFGLPVLEDPDRLLADGRLILIIADEWGEI